jgi:hypothetical protein
MKLIGRSEDRARFWVGPLIFGRSSGLKKFGFSRGPAWAELVIPGFFIGVYR